jgi:hypothetical protein
MNRRLTIDNVVWQREKINAKKNVEQKSINRMERVFGFCAVRCIFMRMTEGKKLFVLDEKFAHMRETAKKQPNEKILSTIFFVCFLSFILVHRINKLLFGCDAKKEFSRFNYAKRNSFEHKAELGTFFHVDENLLNFFRTGFTMKFYCECAI